MVCDDDAVDPLALASSDQLFGAEQAIAGEDRVCVGFETEQWMLFSSEGSETGKFECHQDTNLDSQEEGPQRIKDIRRTHTLHEE